MEHGRRLRDKLYEPDEPYNAAEVDGKAARVTRRIPRNEAYDLARKEFYDLRHRQQLEQRIAYEEAMHVGAYFGQLRLDISMKIEDQVRSDWLAWADNELQSIEASTSRVAGISEIPVELPPAPPAEVKIRSDASLRSGPKPSSSPRATLRSPSMGV